MGRIGARLLGHTRRLLFGIGAALCVAALALTGSLERWEHLWLDELFELRGVRPPTAPIVIVTIDESTFQELNLQWPFPRAARQAHRPDQRRRADRHRARRHLRQRLDVRTQGRRGPRRGDHARRQRRARRRRRAGRAAAPRRGWQGPGVEREVSNLPLPVIRKGAAAVAPVSIVPDPDGHVRRVPIRVAVPDPQKGYEWWLALDAQLHRQAQAVGLPVKPLPDAGRS